MKTVGIIIFTIDLLKILCTGFTNVNKKKVVDLEELEITKDNQHTVNWQPYVGIGMMVLGGAFLILGSKKSLTS